MHLEDDIRTHFENVKTTLSKRHLCSKFYVPSLVTKGDGFSLGMPNARVVFECYM